MQFLSITLGNNGRQNGVLANPTQTQCFAFHNDDWRSLSDSEATRIEPAFRPYTWQTRHTGAAQLERQLEAFLQFHYPDPSGERRVEMTTGGPSGPHIVFWISFPSYVPLNLELITSLPGWIFYSLGPNTRVTFELETKVGRWAPAKIGA
jgi:hypothetical protein